MPYQVITLGQFLDQLSERLDDPTNSFFSREELLAYVTETLRTWAAHTGYWVRRAGFLTTPGQVDYDLSSLVKYQDLSGTDHYPLQRTTTDQELLNQLCHALIEPPISSWSGGWIGTEQFSLSLLVSALSRAEANLQQLCSLYLLTGSQVVDPVPIPQYDLPGDLVNLRQLYWKDLANNYYPLGRQDQYIAGLIKSSSANPDSYSVVSTAPRKIELSPTPTDSGSLYYLYAPGHSTFSPTAGPTALYTLVNFSWALKYNALFSLLNAEGERRDKFRAEYCQMRVNDSLVLAKVFPTVLRVFIDGQEVSGSTGFDIDWFYPTWRNDTGSPNQLVLQGGNLVSLSPVPAITTDHPEGQFAITFDVAENAPVPSLESDYLDISSDLVPPLLDYAHHLACFKLGGQEFSDSIPSYKNFLQLAMRYNAKLAAESNNFELLKEKTDWARRQKPTADDIEEGS